MNKQNMRDCRKSHIVGEGGCREMNDGWWEFRNEGGWGFTSTSHDEFLNLIFCKIYANPRSNFAY